MHQLYAGRLTWRSLSCCALHCLQCGANNWKRQLCVDADSHGKRTERSTCIPSSLDRGRTDDESPGPVEERDVLRRAFIPYPEVGRNVASREVIPSRPPVVVVPNALDVGNAC